ncbi:hypothetical protein Chor_009078 [Crotalus horridus]
MCLPFFPLQHALYLTFSAFGLLHSVRLHRNAPVAGPGYHAFVKFCSARDANRAQQACSGRSLFQKTALKVCICTRQRALTKQTLPLNIHKSQELANYYLGFNSWSSCIITLQNIPGFEDNEKEERGTLPRHHHSKYLCVQELNIPHYGIYTRGIGVAELQVNPNQGNMGMERVVEAVVMYPKQNKSNTITYSAVINRLFSTWMGFCSPPKITFEDDS